MIYLEQWIRLILFSYISEDLISVRVRVTKVIPIEERAWYRGCEIFQLADSLEGILGG